MKRTRQSAFTLLLTLCVTLGLLPALMTPAAAMELDSVKYLDATVGTDNTVTFTEATCSAYTFVTASGTAWGAANETKWYVADGNVTITSRVTVTGDVRLILKDGAELTASAGITVAGDNSAELEAADTGDNSAELKAADTGGNSLTIYAQSTDAATMGKLSATGGNYQGGIGGGDQQSGGAITVNGGAVTANGGDNGAGIGGGLNGGAGTLTLGEDATVMAGDNADGATNVTTTFASSHTQKYAKITFAAAAPSYTVTAADTVTTEKKYHYGDDVTIAVTVSGADFEGGEFTLTYDSATLEVKTYPANNKFTDSEQTAGKTAGTVKFEAQTKTKITDGQALATITFTVKTKVTTETTCNFTFEGTPKICYDTDKDSVEAATVTTGSVVVEPITYAVTLTGNDGVTFVNASSQTITTDTAIDGQAFTAQMGTEFDPNNYVYTVTLTIGGAEVTPALTPNSEGKIIIPAEKVAIPDTATDKTIVLTVGRTFGNFKVETTENYVTGWTLVTVAKASGRTDEPVYNYDSKPMYYVNAYNAYAYLIEGAVTADEAKAKVSLGTSAAGTLAASEQYDVNHTGKVDYSDALLTYRCYVLAHPEQDTKTEPATAMETYLRADVNGNKKVGTTDVSAIDANRTTQEAPSA